MKKAGNAVGKTITAIIDKFCVDGIDTLLRTGATTIATGSAIASGGVLLPLLGLIGVHTGLNYLNREKKNDDLDLLESRFGELKEKLSKPFEELWQRDCTQLEHILEVELGLKKQGEALGDIKAFCESVYQQLKSGESTLDTIASELRFSLNELNEIGKLVERKLDNLNRHVKEIRDNVSLVLDRQEQSQSSMIELRKMMSQLTAQRNDNYESPLLEAAYNIGVEYPVKTGVGAEFDLIIKELSKSINGRRIQVARQQLNVLANSDDYNDSIKAKAWMKAISGQIELACGDGNKAIQDFEASYNLANSSFPATIPLELLLMYAEWYATAGNNTEAYNISDRIRKESDGALKASATALWIRTSAESYYDIKAAIGEEECQDYKVLDALARKAIDAGLLGEAENYARQSISQAKKLGQKVNYTLIGYILLLERCGESVRIGFDINKIDRNCWSDFTEIVNSYTSAVEEIETFATSLHLSTFYYQLALVYFLVDDYQSFEIYLDKFSELEAVDAENLKAILMMLRNFNKIDKALSVCLKREERLMKHPCLMQVYASFLFEKYGYEDKKAFQLLESAQKMCPSNDELLYFSISTELGIRYIESSKTQELHKLIESLKNENIKWLPVFLEGITLVDEPEAAKIKFNEAISELSMGKDVARGASFSMLPYLKQIGDLPTWLELAERFIVPREFTTFNREYFNTTIECRDYVRFAKFCKEMRDNGCFEWEAILVEIQVTAAVSKSQALTLVQEFLNIGRLQDRHAELRIWEAMLQKELGVSYTLENYPQVLSLEKCFPFMNIPLLLIDIDRNQEAVEYAYSLYQRFRDVRDVRRVFISTILKSAIDAKDYTQVQEDVAVTCTSESGDHNFTVIIENSPFSNEADYEYKPTHELAYKLMGRRVGDKFTVSGIDRQIYEVSNIVCKYSYKFQQFIKLESEAPTDRSFIMVSTPEAPNGGVDFTALNNHLNLLADERNKRISKAVKFYEESFSSVYLFTKHSGLELEDTLRYFSSQDKLKIYVVEGVREEVESCFNLLKENKTLLLSPLSIRILFFLYAYFDLDIFSILNSSGIKIAVSEYLLDELISDNDLPASEGKIFAGDERPYIDVENNSRRLIDAHRLGIDFLQSSQVIKGNLFPANFDDTKAEHDFQSMFGRSLYHTYLLATDDDYVLWDDDTPLINMFNSIDPEQKTPHRIFSQGLFSALKRLMLFNDDDIVTTTAFLLTVNEYFVSINAYSVVKIMMELKKFGDLGRRILNYIEDTKVEPHSLFIVLSEAIKTMWLNYSRNRVKQPTIDMIYALIKRNDGLVKLVLTNIINELDKKNSQKKLKAFSQLVNEMFSECIDFSLRTHLRSRFNLSH